MEKDEKAGFKPSNHCIYWVFRFVVIIPYGHTFATRALELGVDIKTLSEILGHANVTITLNIYAHSLMEQKKAAMDRFNDLHITHMTVSPFAVTENRH